MIATDETTANENYMCTWYKDLERGNEDEHDNKQNDCFVSNVTNTFLK